MYGELAVARAIGSAAWKRDPSRRALIPTPDLVSIQLQPEDDFVVLATDGLWDKVDNTQVCRGDVGCGVFEGGREGWLCKGSDRQGLGVLLGGSGGLMVRQCLHAKQRPMSHVQVCCAPKAAALAAQC